MNDQVILALIKLIETGGTYAIWGIIAFYGIHLLEVIAVGLFVFLTIRSIAQAMFKK